MAIQTLDALNVYQAAVAGRADDVHQLLDNAPTPDAVLAAMTGAFNHGHMDMYQTICRRHKRSLCEVPASNLPWQPASARPAPVPRGKLAEGLERAKKQQVGDDLARLLAPITEAQMHAAVAEPLLAQTEAFGVWLAGHACTAGRRAPPSEDRATTQLFASGVMVAGVFDGHGGAETAEFAVDNLPPMINAALLGLPNDASPDTVRWTLKDVFCRRPADAAVGKSFDAMLSAARPEKPSGTTAIVAVFLRGDLYIANLGDSRAVLCNVDGSAQRLSVDHRPADPAELKKLAARGSTVMYRQYAWRTDACIAMSRALGDHHVRVLRRPQITFVPRARLEGCTLVMVCDGVTDAIHDDAIASFITMQTQLGVAPGELARGLVQAAYARGSSDNMTALVIPLPRAF